MTYKDIGRGIICNWSVLEILAKKEIYFFIAKKNTDEWKPEWYIAPLFQLKFQMDEDFTCQILYTVIAIYIFHSDHLSVSALLTLFKTKPKMCLDTILIFAVLFFSRDSKFGMACSWFIRKIRCVWRYRFIKSQIFYL